MQRLDGRLIVSAHDLVGFLGCEHVTVLDLEVAEEKREKPEYTEDPQLKLLQKRGFEHEARCLERLEAEGRTVREIQKAGFTLDTLERAERETLAAMREGVAVVYQGTLLGDGRWRGHPDFLVRVERPSALGPWSYEPADAKLAQRVKAAALLQLCMYADRLEALQGVAPEHVHVVTGDGETPPAPPGRLRRLLPDGQAPLRGAGVRRRGPARDLPRPRRPLQHLPLVVGLHRPAPRRRPPLPRGRHQPPPDEAPRGRGGAHADRARHPPARRAEAGARPPDARESCASRRACSRSSTATARSATSSSPPTPTTPARAWPPSPSPRRATSSSTSSRTRGPSREASSS